MLRNIRNRYLRVDEELIAQAFRQAISVRDHARLDDGRGDRHVDKRMRNWRYYIRRLVTEQPFIRQIGVGIIISVDTNTKTCVVAIDGIEAPITNVKYYPPNKTPAVNTKHLVHFEAKLPTRTVDEDSRVEEGERWIRQLETLWLYILQRVLSSPLTYALKRVSWPFSDEPEIETIIATITNFTSVPRLLGINGNGDVYIYESVNNVTHTSRIHVYSHYGAAPDSVLTIHNLPYVAVDGSTVTNGSVAPVDLLERMQVVGFGINNNDGNAVLIGNLGDYTAVPDNPAGWIPPPGGWGYYNSDNRIFISTNKGQTWTLAYTSERQSLFWVPPIYLSFDFNVYEDLDSAVFAAIPYNNDEASHLGVAVGQNTWLTIATQYAGQEATPRPLPISQNFIKNGSNVGGGSTIGGQLLDIISGGIDDDNWRVVRLDILPAQRFRSGGPGVDAWYYTQSDAGVNGAWLPYGTLTSPSALTLSLIGQDRSGQHVLISVDGSGYLVTIDGGNNWQALTSAQSAALTSILNSSSWPTGPVTTIVDAP